MRNLLALVGLVVVGFAGVGWYCQWYSFSSKTSLDGRSQLQLDVDTKKIAQDAKALGDRVGTAVQPAADTSTPGLPDPATLMGPPAPPGYQPPASAIEIRVPAPRR